MLLRIIPLNALAKAFTRYDGDKLDGDTSAGWDIVDSFHSPLADSSYSTSMHIDTGYGGGGGTGFPNYFSGGEHSTACLGPALCPSCAARAHTARSARVSACLGLGAVCVVHTGATSGLTAVLHSQVPRRLRTELPLPPTAPCPPTAMATAPRIRHAIEG